MTDIIHIFWRKLEVKGIKEFDREKWMKENPLPNDKGQIKLETQGDENEDLD